MNSLNIIVDFSTYMYFRELKDLARYDTFSRCTSTRSFGFRECDSVLDKSQSLNSVYEMLKFVLLKQCLCRISVKTMLLHLVFKT
ncbi:hypothetical protein Hanom_Chr02g00123431 [Helianthus anomalus]